MKELAPLLGGILAGLYRHEGKKSRITATFAGLGCQGWLKRVQPAPTSALSQGSRVVGAVYFIHRCIIVITISK